MRNFSSARLQAIRERFHLQSPHYQEINLLWYEDEPADAKRFDRGLSQFIAKIHLAYSAVGLKKVERRTIELYFTVNGTDPRAFGIKLPITSNVSVLIRSENQGECFSCIIAESLSNSSKL